VVVTKGLQQRERVKAKLEQALATQFPNAVGRVYPLELGPPVGWPLQYRVTGVEPEQVRDIAFNVAKILNDDPSARNVNYNWMEPARTVRIRVDQDQARLLGLSSENLAQTLNTVVSGITSTQTAQRHLSRRCSRAGPLPSSACRSRRSARFRCRCRTGRPFRLARSHPSNMARNIPSSGAATVGLP
jgi:Cation/multidrug efflux pump